MLRAAFSDVVDVHEADSIEAAVEQAFALAKPGGVVLLAPACASFDMFRDYAERGRRFKDEVKRLFVEQRKRDRAQELVQDSFVKLYLKMSRGEPIDNPRAAQKAAKRSSSLVSGVNPI